MDFSVAYSAKTEGSNTAPRRICFAQGHRGKKVADSTGVQTRDLPVGKPTCLIIRPPALPGQVEGKCWALSTGVKPTS